MSKVNLPSTARKTLVMETPEQKKPPACRVQAKCAAKKAPDATVASPSKITEVVIQKEEIDSDEVEFIDVTDNGNEAVNPMTMTVYNNVVLNTLKYTSPKNVKKCIQVFVSNVFLS